MTSAPPAVTIDFETFPIVPGRPSYPPEPVGVSIHWPHEERGHYWAFGHSTNNNCEREEAVSALAKAWYSGLPLLFHHAKFDVAIAVERLCMAMPLWDDVHDTQFQAYLCDPHARSTGLKELAKDFLSWPTDEKDELDNWIMEHAPMLLQTYPWAKQSSNQIKITKKQCGAWIFATPGDIAGRYAVGDTSRTRALHEHLWPIVQHNGMGLAYDRERQLVPILMENEREGICVDVPGLERDVEEYGTHFDATETWLRQTLGAVPDFNFDADQETAKLLISSGAVPETEFVLTEPTKAHPNGQYSMSKDNLLPSMFTDPQVASALGYRNRLKTCLDMFMRPWLTQAQGWNGRIGTNWNQIRNPGGGTRTGRPSTNDHNFLNISKSFDGRDDGYVHPGHLIYPDGTSVRPLPLCRKYILPDPGCEFLHRDFDGQELRVFAHFEQGDLFGKYQEDPALDPHKFVGSELMRVAGREIERTKVKVLNFQALYGGGVPALVAKLRCSVKEGKELKEFHNKALPGRVILNDVIKAVVAQGLPIRTWGGRLYYPEAPGPDGRSKVYKLINYEIQGSAADITKQTLIDWYAVKDRSSRFLVTVYDEINISAPMGDEAVKAMRLLKELMEEPRITVPMRSSPKHGATWGDSKKCKPETGCPLCQ